MSGTQTPATVAFDLQRHAIEQTQDLFTRSIETQRSVAADLVDFEPARQANERSYELARTLVDSYFDTLASGSVTDDEQLDEARAAVADQLDALEATQSEALAAVETNAREGNEAVDELVYAIVDSIDQQFDAVLDAHAEVEDETVAALSEFEGSLTEFQEELETYSEQVAEQVEAGIDAQVGVADQSLDAVDGLGATYAGRLQEQGIETLETLAEANTTLVAEAADVTEQVADEWITAAESAA